MKLIVVSPPNYLKNEHNLLAALFENGLQHYHLRKPNYSYEQQLEYLQKIPQKHHSKIIVHQHYDIIKDILIKGIHFPSKNTDKIPYNYKAKLIISRSCSCHSFYEIIKHNGKFDYCFFSPVFSSISKSNYHPEFSIEDIKNFIKNNTLQTSIIALGGIHENNITTILKAGFNGVAILGAIWKRFEQYNNINTTIKIFKKIQLACQTNVRMF